MIELLQITADPAMARQCDELAGMRIFVDLERHGKAERQAGRNTFISTHQMDDIAPVKAVLRNTRLMVRTNPLHAHSAAEIDQVLARGADLLMLPMFRSAAELSRYCGLVAGRVPVVPLLETREALQSLPEWIGQPGLGGVFIGLNDLHLSLGCDFMFEPLARGIVDEVAQAARQHQLPFGFGGIARLDEGLLPGRDVLAEHLRLGSTSVILSRTFHRSDAPTPFATEVAGLREAEVQLAARSPQQVLADQRRIAQRIGEIAADMAAVKAAGIAPRTPVAAGAVTGAQR